MNQNRQEYRNTMVAKIKNPAIAETDLSHALEMLKVTFSEDNTPVSILIAAKEIAEIVTTTPYEANAAANQLCTFYEFLHEKACLLDPQKNDPHFANVATPDVLRQELGVL